MSTAEHPRRRRALIAIGVAIAAAALAADLLGIGGHRGFGDREMAFLGLGASLVALGVWGDTRRYSVAAALSLFACAGLWCGALDAVHASASAAWFDAVIHKPADYAWMMPVSNALLFTVVGVAWLLVGVVVPSLRALPVVVFGAALLAAWGVLTKFGWLHGLVAGALTVGAARAVAAWAVAAPVRFLAVARWSGAAVVVAAVALAALLPWAAHAREQRALAALPPPPAGAPDVLLIVLDTTRADHLQCYGYPRDTSPTLARLAEQGALFTRAWSTAPWTLTSHASMFTGRYPFEVSADWQSALDGAPPTLAEVLRDRGYATAGFVGNLFYCGAENGIDRGFVHYQDYLLRPEVVATAPNLVRSLADRLCGDQSFSYMRNDADEVSGGFLAWLAQRDAERPYFAFLNFFDAHAFYDPPPEYESRYGPRVDYLDDMHRVQLGRNGNLLQGYVDAYDACLRYIDDRIARVIDALAQRGSLERTLIVVTSDHGEMFGEHGLIEHANCLYRPVLHVPLLFHWPGVVQSGLRIETPTSLVDLPSTVLQLALGSGGAELLPGRSLADRVRGVRSDVVGSPVLATVSKGINLSPALPVSKGDMATLRLGDLHLIRNGDGSEELYDLAADPGCQRDLIGDDALAGPLRTALDAALAASR